MSDYNFMHPGCKSIVMIREDQVVDLHDSPRIEQLDTPMDPIGDGGSQKHPAKPAQKRHMDYFGR